MPRLRCPRCANVVDVAPGAAPSCPSCGFGARPAPAAAPAPAPAPAPVAPAPAPVPAPQGGGGNTGRVVAIVAVGLVVLAGAAAAAFFLLKGGSPAEPLTEAEARSRVAASLQAANGLFNGEAADGDLVRMDARATPPAGGGSDPFGGFGSMRMTFEWGRDGASQVKVDASNGPVTVAFTMTCAQDRRAMEYGGQVHVSRPYVDGVQDCMDPFGESSMDPEDPDAGEGGIPDDAFPTLDDLRAEDAVITINDDGSVRAVIAEAGGEAVLDLDPKGRLRSVSADSPSEGSWTMTLEYGSRRAISLPEGGQPMPAEVAAWETEELDDGTRVWTVDGSPQEPPLSEMEVRIQPYGMGFGFLGEDGEEEPEGSAPEEVLSFPAHVRGPQVQGNHTVEYRDADGDGKVSEGDSWTLRDAALADAESEDPWGFSFPDYEVVLYDKPAQAAVNESPVGAPGPGWLALAGLALGLALMRRRAA